jgi:hypothetical protein
MTKGDDVSKTLNQPIRGNPTYELRLALQSPPVLAGPGNGCLAYNFSLSFFFLFLFDLRHCLNWEETVADSAEAKFVPALPACSTCHCHCAVHTLERGSEKEIILSVAKCYSFGSGLLT